MNHFSTFTSSPIHQFTWNRYWKHNRLGFGQDRLVSAILVKATMDSRDIAPDSWEQEDDVEATADSELQSAFTGLNVNAPEFVPSFLSRGPPENDTSDGKLTAFINRLTALMQSDHKRAFSWKCFHRASSTDASDYLSAIFTIAEWRYVHFT